LRLAPAARRRGSRVAAQEQIVSMDNEPHYSRIFSNEYCRAYAVRLGRLEETKPVAHEHDWVRMALHGMTEQAWGGTLFARTLYEDPEGSLISFLFPVDRLTLRNPGMGPYQGVIVEIMKSDDSRNRLNDSSLNHFGQMLGPGIDPHLSYVTSLTKTSVEIMNVQLLGGDSKELHSIGAGSLVLALTDLDLSRTQAEGQAKELQLTKGDVQWFPAPPRPSRI
jgi:hypothetical protein